MTEAEALARKAELKADLPEKYTAAVEMKLARIDLEAAQAELRMAKQRYQHVLRLGQAELAYLRDRHARFASRAARLESAIEKMTVVTAPGRGGGLPEQLAGREEEGGGRVLGGRALPGGHRHQGDGGPGRGGRGGQRPGGGRASGCALRLEALPELEWPGTVASVRPNVYRQSPRNPLKVMGVQIKLDKTDASRMRPGMQFRGRLETGRIKGALLAAGDGGVRPARRPGRVPQDRHRQPEGAGGGGDRARAPRWSSSRGWPRAIGCWPRDPEQVGS